MLLHPSLSILALLAHATTSTASSSSPITPSTTPHRGRSTSSTSTAQRIIQHLHLTPNIEGGYYRQTFEDPVTVAGNRSASTLIYYLLRAQDGPSRWHRLDATEVWHFYAGAPLTLSLSRDDGSPVDEPLLGPRVLHGQAPQVVVPRGVWQRARSRGEWTLVVAPGFTSSGFELAPPGWEPKGSY
ncbi:hypothetical protein E4U41_006100 [Claviceps citrina]|nr:hypothetical protein E4U41_006100 [Claviceps citrina]